MWRRGSRSVLWPYSSHSTLHFYEYNPRSQLPFWAVILHNGLDIAIKMTKTCFPQNLKLFCIAILQHIFFSQIPIICKLNQHRPFKASVEIFFQDDWYQCLSPFSGYGFWSPSPSQKLSFCPHFFIFPTRTSCEALSKFLLKEKPFF